MQSDKDEDNDEDSTQFFTIDTIDYQELMKDEEKEEEDTEEAKEDNEEIDPVKKNCVYHCLTSSLSKKTCNIIKLRDNFSRFDCNIYW